MHSFIQNGIERIVSFVSRDSGVEAVRSSAWVQVILSSLQGAVHFCNSRSGCLARNVVGVACNNVLRIPLIGGLLDDKAGSRVASLDDVAPSCENARRLARLM